MLIDTFIERMPKAELHCHFYGAIPRQTVTKLAERNSVRLPNGKSARSLYDFKTLDEFFKLTPWVASTVRSIDDFRVATYDSLVHARSSSNVRYQEFFFGASLLQGITYKEALRGVCQGIRDAETDAGITGRIIPVIQREFGKGAAEELVRIVTECQTPEVVGVGLAGNENSIEPEAFVDAFRMASTAGLSCTAHAGEQGSADPIRVVMEQLKCRRVDHGYTVMQSPELVQRAIDLGVHFTGCWWTSEFLYGGGTDGNPIGAMLQAGLDVSINTDDPAVFGTDMNREFSNAARALLLQPAALARITMSTVGASFADPDLKESLLRGFDRELALLGQESRRIRPLGP